MCLKRHPDTPMKYFDSKRLGRNASPVETKTTAHVRRTAPFCVIAACMLSTTIVYPCQESVPSQETETVLPRIESEDEIVIDGRVDEPLWLQGKPVKNFRVNNKATELPPASDPTLAYVFYDEAGLYVAAKMPQVSNEIVERITAQESGGMEREFFTVMLDTSGNGRYGYYFTIFLGDNHLDGTIRPERGFDDTWDGVWEGKSHREDDQWSVEFFIPWSILNLPRAEGTRTMGILLERHIAAVAEKSSWPAIHHWDTKFLSKFIKFEAEELKGRRQMDIVPYVSYTNDLAGRDATLRYGADVIYRPAPHLQVTGVLRPDFGTVDADAAILNFGAFETFFPEKRLFFQEGMEVFRTYGAFSPLHTRRIGDSPIVHDLPSDVEFDFGQLGAAADLLTAAKVTGELGKVRYGILGAFEDDTSLFGTRGDAIVKATLKGRNFAVIRGMFEPEVNGYRAMGFISTFVDHPSMEARVSAFDYRQSSEKGNLNFDWMLVHSDVSGQQNGNGGSLSVEYAPSEDTEHQFLGTWIDKNLDLNDMGFLWRNDWRDIYYQYSRRAIRETGRVAETELEVNAFSTWNHRDELIDAAVSIYRHTRLRNLNAYWWTVGYRIEQVDDGTAFGVGTFTSKPGLSWSFDWRTDQSRQFFYHAWTGMEQADLSGYRFWRGIAFNWRVREGVQFNQSVRHSRHSGWLNYQGDLRVTEFDFKELLVTSSVAYYISSKQHVRLVADWAAVKARPRRDYEFNETRTDLVKASDLRSEGFAVGHVHLQIRYHWEFARFSNLYLVYTNSGRVSDEVGQSFPQLLTNPLSDSYSEFLVAKVRYRFGR